MPILRHWFLHTFPQTQIHTKTLFFVSQSYAIVFSDNETAHGDGDSLSRGEETIQSFHPSQDCTILIAGMFVCLLQ